MQKLRPILFNTEMVRAILDGRKTVTRRIANINTEMTCNDGTTNHDFLPDNFNHRFDKPTGFVCRKCGFGVAPRYSRFPCGTSLFRPRYWPGDIMYVRETWGNYSYDDPESNAAYFMYRADFPDDAKGYWYEPEHIHFCDFPRWRPSIHMPKEAARLFLRVNYVRLEHLQAISADECAMEGVWPLYAGPIGARESYYKAAFAKLWNSTLKPEDIPVYGWEENPWVWVIKFERITKEG